MRTAMSNAVIRPSRTVDIFTLFVQCAMERNAMQTMHRFVGDVISREQVLCKFALQTDTYGWRQSAVGRNE